STFSKPTIAAIQGYCIGGGLNLAIGCDLRFCTEGSRFALPAAKLGLGYGYAGLKRFIDTVGPARTKDIFFSARQFGAVEEVALRFLPIASSLRTLAVTPQSPVFRFTPNRDFVYSREWDFVLENRGRVNNAGFVNDQDYRKDDPLALLAVVGDSMIEAAMVP